jgi:hypothetical protein
MDHEHVALRAIEPGEDEELVAGLDALQPVENVRLEGDPRIGCALVALPGRRRRVGERRLDPADCPEVEGQRYGRVIQSMIGWE